MSLAGSCFQIKEVSSNEYHVLEWRNGMSQDPEKWFVIAKCSGPVPANDVFKALVLAEHFASGQNEIYWIAQKNLIEAAQNALKAIEKYGCVKVPPVAASEQAYEEKAE